MKQAQQTAETREVPPMDLSSIIAADFFVLNPAQVEVLLNEANYTHYRRPRNANGSRARYFHAKLQREKRRSDRA